MKVNPHRDLPSAAPLSPAGKSQPAATPVAPADFAATAELTGQLAATPAVRADQVARAKALLADPHYPNTATIEKIAQRLADNISPAPATE